MIKMLGNHACVIDLKLQLIFILFSCRFILWYFSNSISKIVVHENHSVLKIKFWIWVIVINQAPRKNIIFIFLFNYPTNGIFFIPLNALKAYDLVLSNSYHLYKTWSSVSNSSFLAVWNFQSSWEDKAFSCWQEGITLLEMWQNR